MWRVSTDSEGAVTVTIAQVWAVSARIDAEVYAEMNDRVAAATLSPHTLALAEVVQMLGRHTQRDDLRPAVEPSYDAVPAWLRDRLIHTAGIDGEVVDAMTGEHAMERWERFITSCE